MKATVREYTEKRKVVVVEFDVEEVTRYITFGSNYIFEDVLKRALVDALEADRAEEQRKEDEDVPF